MAIKDALIPEWEAEMKSTRRLLEAIPFDKADWKPHEKSMSLKRLATHVAEIPQWLTVTLQTSELDFAKGYFQNKPETKEELMSLFESSATSSIEELKKATDEDLLNDWTLRMGDRIFFTRQKAKVIRGFAFSHLFHHRGQLTVYLRLLDVPVPGMYGPTADESM
ncbi:MAG TPA: DinB family protein [Chitinophagaceae bacterium]|nr:DinB family protein [Chitinophagaceae bacterium]